MTTAVAHADPDCLKCRYEPLDDGACWLHRPPKNYKPSAKLRVVPLTLKRAAEFIKQHHRHHKPPTGMKFAIGVLADGVLVGVATAGRPVARAYASDGLDGVHVLEVNRTCTDGTLMANGLLYGAVRRAAAAMGYGKIITYTEEGESGATMRGVGFRREAELPARGSWAQESLALRHKRDPEGTGGKARIRWVWP